MTSTLNCTIGYPYKSDSGEYWCEGGGGARSNTVNITVTGMLAVCRFRFYHNTSMRMLPPVPNAILLLLPVCNVVQLVLWFWRVLSCPWWRGKMWLWAARRRRLLPTCQLISIKMASVLGAVLQERWLSTEFPSLMKETTSATSLELETHQRAGCMWEVNVIKWKACLCPFFYCFIKSTLDMSCNLTDLHSIYAWKGNPELSIICLHKTVTNIFYGIVQMVLWSWTVLMFLWRRETPWLCAVETRILPPTSKQISTKMAASSGAALQESWPYTVFPSLMKDSTNAEYLELENHQGDSCLSKVRHIVSKQLILLHIQDKQQPSRQNYMLGFFLISANQRYVQIYMFHTDNLFPFILRIGLHLKCGVDGATFLIVVQHRCWLSSAPSIISNTADSRQVGESVQTHEKHQIPELTELYLKF